MRRRQHKPKRLPIAPWTTARPQKRYFCQLPRVCVQQHSQAQIWVKSSAILEGESLVCRRQHKPKRLPIAPWTTARPQKRYFCQLPRVCVQQHSQGLRTSYRDSNIDKTKQQYSTDTSTLIEAEILKTSDWIMETYRPPFFRPVSVRGGGCACAVQHMNSRQPKLLYFSRPCLVLL